jgi:hypothetical protein
MTLQLLHSEFTYTMRKTCFSFLLVHSHTLSVYTVRLLWEEGQQFTRGVENTNMTDCVSSL